MGLDSEIFSNPVMVPYSDYWTRKSASDWAISVELRIHFKEIKMDLEGLIELHDKQKETQKICSCQNHIFHSECERDKQKSSDNSYSTCSEDHEVIEQSHPTHDNCSCSLAVAIRTFQLKTIGKMIDHGKLNQAGEIIRTVDLGLDGSTVTPKSFVAIHSELYNYLNGLNDDEVLTIHHQFQKLIDHARVGDGIVTSFYSDRLKRATEEQRGALREQDKEFDKIHRYSSAVETKKTDDKETIKKQLEKLKKMMEKLS